MQEPTLVILAAGMGSRYGGLKQIDPVDAHGNLIIDYSIYDAVRAGFNRVVCIIKKEIEQDFEALFGKRIRERITLSYAYQEMDKLPGEFTLPAQRIKPWGTGHALLCAWEEIYGPFAVINADDYYGPGAYQEIYQYLCAPHPQGEWAMVGYPVESTLSDYGTVTRGVCQTDRQGFLEHIEETHGIARQGAGGVFTKDGATVNIPAGTTISMNFWGFDMSLFAPLADGFAQFLETGLTDPLKAEYLLPSAIEDFMRLNKGCVKVLKSQDAWFGVTYKEDKQYVMNAIQALKDCSVYPQNLWGCK